MKKEGYMYYYVRVAKGYFRCGTTASCINGEHTVLVAGSGVSFEPSKEGGADPAFAKNMADKLYFEAAPV